jgi:hypothetical protein
MELALRVITYGRMHGPKVDRRKKEPRNHGPWKPLKEQTNYRVLAEMILSVLALTPSFYQPMSRGGEFS